jgi:hypothetical protein
LSVYFLPKTCYNINVKSNKTILGETKMKTPTPMVMMNAADFLKAWEKDIPDTTAEPAYVVEGGPGEFMPIEVGGADTLDAAIEDAKEAKVEFGFFKVWVRETKTGNIVYKG